ncbi:50S ribosomal protein L11 methyltransferase [Arachidicoccus soli]|uniref:Ribosomal protein L11 methyltransferase n=1 Tax=Arachidicoccus soli TaxID=2341117 RepID=A0A386HRJ9_9BACT|nr:50S ribosomal protein L11 methyltransferase [Arachidicoccus soli]AYD48061.1 50S ribosomal protein L11 methyltransferase [Arachidicoccus soli]
MKTYIEIIIEHIDNEKSDILLALLSEQGFEGFEETNSSLKAFIDKELYKEHLLNDLAAKEGFSFRLQNIEEQNWNALWESNFEPVVVDDFVAVRAIFHQEKFKVEHEILITPKMSFGTGHHATTFMMMQQMRHLNFENKNVLDFGTGTGVLAILAEQLGASEVLALDNDDWSIENGIENVKANHCKKITVRKAHSALTENKFAIILANINKNVILANAETLANQLIEGGILLLSGLLSEDEQDIIQTFSSFKLHHTNTEKRAQWISMLWKKE